jgi:hypothetical protein
MLEMCDREVREDFLEELRCILSDALRTRDLTGPTAADTLTQDKILDIIKSLLTSKSVSGKEFMEYVSISIINLRVHTGQLAQQMKCTPPAAELAANLFAEIKKYTVNGE